MGYIMKAEFPIFNVDFTFFKFSFLFFFLFYTKEVLPLEKIIIPFGRVNNEKAGVLALLLSIFFEYLSYEIFISLFSYILASGVECFELFETRRLKVKVKHFSINPCGR